MDPQAVSGPDEAAAYPPPSMTWWHISHDPNLSVDERRCVAQATLHADRLIVGSGRLSPAGLAVRDEEWHALAVTEYQNLARTAPREIDTPLIQLADPQALAAWLAGPPPHEHASSYMSMSEFLGVGTEPPSSYLPGLVGQAQRAGMLGLPGHTIELHELAVPEPEPVTYLLTVATPGGATVTANPVPIEELTEHRVGFDAAITAIQCCAGLMQHALAEYDGPRRDPLPGRGRPFLAAPGTQPTNAAVAWPREPPPAPTSPADHHHR